MDLNTLLNTPPWDWPIDAGKLFLKTLADQQASESDRLIAAELAGDLVAMNDDLADALLAIVGSKDESEELRATAAIGLGPVLEQADIELVDDEEFDDPECVPITLHTFRNLRDSLHQLYLDESNPQEVRRRILEAAVRAPQDWQKDATRVAYSSGDKDWVLTAVFAMGYIRGFDDQILESMESADLETHFQAIRAAGHWELDAAWSHVVQLVENPATPKPLLLAAIEAVGNIRPAEAGEILVDLTDSRDEDIADAADEAIAMAQASSADHRFCGPRLFPGRRHTVTLSRPRQRRAAHRKPGGLRYGLTRTFRAVEGVLGNYAERVIRRIRNEERPYRRLANPPQYLISTRTTIGRTEFMPSVSHGCSPWATGCRPDPIGTPDDADALKLALMGVNTARMAAQPGGLQHLLALAMRWAWAGMPVAPVPTTSWGVRGAVI